MPFASINFVKNMSKVEKGKYSVKQTQSAREFDSPSRHMRSESILSPLPATAPALFSLWKGKEVELLGAHVSAIYN